MDETFPSTRPLKISGIEEAEAFLDVQGTNPRARTHQASLDAAIEVTLASVTLEVGGVGGSTMALGAATPKKITLGCEDRRSGAIAPERHVDSAHDALKSLARL